MPLTPSATMPRVVIHVSPSEWSTVHNRCTNAMLRGAIFSFVSHTHDDDEDSTFTIYYPIPYSPEVTR